MESNIVLGSYTVRNLENGRARITADVKTIQTLLLLASGGNLLGTINERIDALAEKVEFVSAVIQKQASNATQLKGNDRSTKMKLQLNIPKTTAGVPEDKDEMRRDIKTLIAELCAKDGLRYGIAWTKAYRLLEAKTGFDVYAVSKTKVRGKVSLISTVIDHGKGTDLCRALRSYLDN